MLIALGLAIVAQFGLVIASLIFSAMSVPTGTSWIAAMAEPLAFGIVTLTFPTVGAVVLLRRPSHPIGRLMSIVALGWALGNASSRFAQFAFVARGGGVPGGEWALWLSGAWTTVVSQGLLLVIMLLFPTGSLLSPSWRPVAWLVGVWTAVTCLAFAFASGRLDNDLGVVISNPAAAPDPIGAGLAAIAEPLQFGVFVLFAIAAISPLLRFRRSRGIERQQLKWIAGANCQQRSAQPGLSSRIRRNDCCSMAVSRRIIVDSTLAPPCLASPNRICERPRYDSGVRLWRHRDRGRIRRGHLCNTIRWV